jgi:hypothetical protein
MRSLKCLFCLSLIATAALLVSSTATRGQTREAKRQATGAEALQKEIPFKPCEQTADYVLAYAPGPAPKQ